MPILVIAEHDNAHLKASTHHTLGAAQTIGGDVHVLVAGAGCEGVAQAAAQAAGVSKVLLADASHYKDELAESLALLVVQ
ncbi:MAG TPA: electron transfer flavoprotein subunit alpha/FixB family protein, partial [Burkholderiales bacterium]|nr:electron transfer flavoprotein subunit alpha/FixB family protein [Burkholderiales bacterium]